MQEWFNTRKKSLETQTEYFLECIKTFPRENRVVMKQVTAKQFRLAAYCLDFARFSIFSLLLDNASRRL